MFELKNIVVETSTPKCPVMDLGCFLDDFSRFDCPFLDKH